MTVGQSLRDGAALAMKQRELVELLASMTTPTDGVTNEEQADDIMADLDDETLCGAAATLYEIIRVARTISRSA